MTQKQEIVLNDKISAFVNATGNRWNSNAYGSLTKWAVDCGVSYEELIDRLALAVTIKKEHRDKLRRDMATAQAKFGNSPSREYRSRATSPEKKRNAYTQLTRDYIHAGGGRAEPSPRTFAAFMGEPLDGLLPNEQTARWLAELFDPDALMFVTAKGRAEDGRICETVSDYCGGNIRKCSEWLDMARRGVRLPGDIITPNPLTGERRETIDSQGRRKYSLILQECFASVPYFVLELDHLPLTMQTAFWLGFLRVSDLAPLLASLVLSGGRSIHALLRVDKTLTNWETMRDRLCEQFAVDEETRTITKEDGQQETVYPFRIDGGAIAPITKTRIAGGQRDGSGEVQPLLYLRSPFTARPCSDAAATMCGACERFSICGFRHPDAVRGTTILRKR